MKNTLSINNTNLMIKEYKGKRVVTFKDIDLVHNRPAGTARDRFNSNKKHFVEGEDYYKITRSTSMYEFHTLKNVPPKGLTLLTESGYLMLVKSFTDDLAWDVQRQLVNSYFRAQEAKQLEMYDYFEKKYRGQEVLTVADIAHYTGLERCVVSWYASTKLRRGVDCYLVNGNDLSEFKRENPKVSTYISVLLLITRTGFQKICKSYGIKLDSKVPALELKEEPAKEYALVRDNLEFQQKKTAIIKRLNAIDTMLNMLDEKCVEVNRYHRLTGALKDILSPLIIEVCDCAEIMPNTTSTYTRT